MPLRRVHELTFLWFGLPGPLLKNGHFSRGGGGAKHNFMDKWFRGNLGVIWLSLEVSRDMDSVAAGPLSQKRRVSPKRKFGAGYPTGNPSKNFGQALQILEEKHSWTCCADIHERTSVWKTLGWCFRSLLRADRESEREREREREREGEGGRELRWAKTRALKKDTRVSKCAF